MDRNVLYIFVAALAVGLVVLGYATYQQQKQIDSIGVTTGG